MKKIMEGYDKCLLDTRILMAVILLTPIPIMSYQTRILRLSHPHVFIMSMRQNSSLNLILEYPRRGFTATPFPRDLSFKFRDKLCNVGSLLLACPMSANGLLQPKCAAKINIYFETNKFLPVFFHF